MKTPVLKHEGVDVDNVFHADGLRQNDAQPQKPTTATQTAATWILSETALVGLGLPEAAYKKQLSKTISGAVCKVLVS